MRSVSAAMQTALASTVTTLGWLCHISPVSGSDVYLNNFGKDVVVGGQTYLANPGFEMGDLRVTDGTDPPAVEISLPIDASTTISFDDAIRRKLDRARVYLYVIDWTTLENVQIGYQWWGGNVTALDSMRATLDIRAVERDQRTLSLKVVGPGCKWDFGSPGCGVDVPSLWQDSVTVSSYTDAFTLAVSGMRAGAVDDSYAEGAVKFTSGENSGYAYTVRRSTKASGQLKLWEPLRAPVANGDTALLHFGCPKTVAGCTVFDNISRRLAHEDLPVDDLTFDVSDTTTWAA